ncbi:MAG: cytochrome c3 family protein [Nitrospinae bacterium]|nr:cytochrome c3 family protein [Nitrospinota bacterium]
MGSGRVVLRAVKEGLALLFLIVIIAVAFFSPAAFADDAENVCVSCHMELDDVLKQVAVDWQESAHAKAGIQCQHCHGGNPYDVALAMESSQGFKKKPAPNEIPALCSKCHSDPVRMRAYNLRSDQYDLFRFSVHGRKLLEQKDAEAPSCVSCHGKHDIRKVDDPQAKVNRKNIVKTCASCHANKELMDKRKLPHNQLELYTSSVHGKAYFEKGDLGVPTCFNCHGNHGIEKPQTLATRFVCANCHVEEADAFKKSRHWAAAQEGGKPLCVHCHSNHGIERATLDKFTGQGQLDCVSCHKDSANIMTVAQGLNESMSKAKGALSSAEFALKGMEEWSGSGFETSGLKEKVAKAQKIYKEMQVGAHALDGKAIDDQSAAVVALSNDVMGDVNKMLTELRKRKLGLIATWVVAFAFCTILWKRSQYCRRDD